MKEVFEDVSLLADIYEFDCSATTIYETMCRAEIAAVMENDNTFLMEGFQDVINSMVTGIKKMIKAIKEFFAAFFRAIRAYNMSLEQYAKEYRKELLAATPDFKIKGYDFKVMDSKDPDMSDFQKLVSSYNTSLTNISKMKIEDISIESQEVLSDKNLDEVRGRVLGVSGPVVREDFREEVRKFYRGSKDTEDIHITSAEVKEIVDRSSKLTTMAKKATSDRDKIIALLSKAEVFFGRKVTTVYRGSTGTASAKTIDYDDDYKMKYGDSDVSSSEDNLKKINQLITYKYNETKAISGIINTVISERANAFKDMVKQDRKVLGMALNPLSGKDKDAIKDANVEESIGYPINYSDLSMEADLILEETLLNAQRESIMQEYNWIMKSLEEGVVFEEVVMEGVVRDLIDKIAQLLQNFLNIFRKKAQDLSEKYGPWYNEKELLDYLQANAKNMEFDLIPHWKGSWSKDLANVGKLLDQIIKKPTDMTKCPWARPFITANTIEELKADKDKVNKLKNYFRVGKKDATSIQMETIRGNKLVGLLPQMLDYVKKYADTAGQVAALNSRLKNLQKANLESVLNMNSYSVLLEAYIKDTDLGLMEADEVKSNQQSVLNNGTKAAKASVTDAKGNGASATKVVNKSEEDVKSNAPGAKDESGVSSKEYYTVALNFAKDTVNAFISTMEDRYYAYHKLLMACAGDWAPEFDKDGAYVGVKAKSKKNKNNKEETTKEKKAETKEDASEVKVKKESIISKAKKAFKNVGKNGGVKEGTELDEDNDPIFEEVLPDLSHKPTRGTKLFLK